MKMKPETSLRLYLPCLISLNVTVMAKKDLVNDIVSNIKW